MIIRSLDNIKGTDRDVDWGNGKSFRYLLAKDGMGYTLTHTVVAPNTCSLLEYKNHLEACLCVSGSGAVESLATGKTYDIVPGIMYALDKHDAHFLIAKEEELHLVCVFYPALVGAEKHSLEGEASSTY